MRLALPPPLRRPLPSAAALLLLLVGLSLLLDPRGTLGTDTGAKVHTLEVMDQAGTARPVVGYWAEEWDPAGVVHPLYQSRRNDDGEWVAVTTLPFLEAARPLYAWGGYRLALLLPMAGTVAAALIAGALARRLGGGDGALAFWVIGVASPLLLYGLDLWEHSLGVAAIAGAVLLLVDHLYRTARWWQPLAAGVLLGAAATMRTEAFVYGAVAVGVTGIVLVSRQRLGAAASALLLAVVGFLLPWMANRWLEVAVGGQSRTGRASDAVGDAGARVGDRVQQAAVTALGIRGESWGSVLVGAAIVGVVVLAVRAERRGDRRFAAVAAGLAALPYLLVALSGLSFLPGLFAAFPLAVLALLRRPRGAAGLVVAIALGALPLVWALSYVGGAGPQWGGRYVLTSGLLLGVVATVDLQRRHPVVGPALIAVCVGISALSVGWLAVRSREVDELFADLRAVDADVVIVREGFLVREGGAATVDQPWLSATSDDGFATATEVAEAAGARRVAVVQAGDAAPPADRLPADWVELERAATDFVGTDVGIVVYEVTG